MLAQSCGPISFALATVMHPFCLFRARQRWKLPGAHARLLLADRHRHRPPCDDRAKSACGSNSWRVFWGLGQVAEHASEVLHAGAGARMVCQTGQCQSSCLRIHSRSITSLVKQHAHVQRFTRATRSQVHAPSLVKQHAHVQVHACDTKSSACTLTS